MCARYTLRSGPDIVKHLFQLEEEFALEPRYNIAPTQEVAAVTQSREGDRKLRMLRWGLIPTWAKSASAGATMINARAESIKDRPAFRVPFERRRCLLPADGFFEWQDIPVDPGQGSLFGEPAGQKPVKTRKQPYHFTLENDSVFAFAGIWDRWSDPQGNIVDSCCIITTVPNTLLAPIHDRMPVIIGRNDYALWLDRHERDAGELMHLLLPYPETEMSSKPVNPVVGNSRIDSPECVARIAV
jgi:putative SOS response-associated peptidase YedK